MKFKMLNELLEVAMALQPQQHHTLTLAETLNKELQERFEHKELTSKQRRVLNCVKKICEGERGRVIEKDKERTKKDFHETHGCHVDTCHTGPAVA